jgi:O-antigen biosynthesis protein
MTLRRLVERTPVPRIGDVPSVRLVEVDLAEPLPGIPDGTAEWARVLVMLHEQPVGTVLVDLRHGAVGPVALREVVDRELGEVILEPLLEAPADAPLVSVVVPTRNRPGQLAACVDSLLRLDYPAVEVVVVDNAPADDATERMVKERFGNEPRVEYLREERPGASLARNKGMRAAHGDIVAFTDDDAVVCRRWLAALVSGFAGDARVMCVAGLTLPTELDTPAQVAFELYGGMTCGFQRRVYDIFEHRADTLLYPYTAGVFGASNNVAFRRLPFLDRGGFDTALGPATPAFGAEDLDAFLSVILHGFRIVYEPRAVVWHEHRRDFPDLYWQVFTYSAGFTALLLKWALRDRRVALDLARRVPRLLPAALLAAHRGGSEAGCGDYPSQLRWLERLGYLYGPVAYVRSRRATLHK